MALCLAESIIETQGCNPRDQLDKYVLWKTKGHLSWAKWSLGIGGTVRASLDDYLITHRTKRLHQDPTKHAGNGSIMRLAPIPMAFRNNKQMLRACKISSQTTHNVPEAIDACILLGTIIKTALDGKSKNDILQNSLQELPILSGGIENLRLGKWINKSPAMLMTTGYVVTTLEAAMWTFHHKDTFESGAKYILHLGGDADTIGAVYGQIAGAHYGFSEIPERWVKHLKMLDIIIEFSDNLQKLSENFNPSN